MSETSIIVETHFSEERMGSAQFQFLEEIEESKSLPIAWSTNLVASTGSGEYWQHWLHQTAFCEWETHRTHRRLTAVEEPKLAVKSGVVTAGR
jgi:hypothetical protein